MFWRAPAVMIHSAADARVALAPALPVTLVSAPGAALYAGAGWWIGLIAVIRAEYPGRAIADILDCGDAPGRAAEALRAGQRSLVLAPVCGGSDARVRLMAEALGAAVLPRMPAALDLARPGARRRLAQWLAQGDGQGDNEAGFR